MNLPVSTKENIYQFDDISVDCENFRVRKNGQNVTLTPRAFDVLTLLIKNEGRVVEKQEIFEIVWKDTFVSDNALTKIIKEIRHAIIDDAAHPRYIETVPKRGYRFIGKIEEKPIQIFSENWINHAESVIEEESEEREEERKEEEKKEEEKKRDEKIVQPEIQMNSQRFIFSRRAFALSLTGLISIFVVTAWLML
ncbi:MAG TPA: winged helix-turn-helix domain-containing protein, partial [Pyrinomonadaceae bacterium]